MPSRKSSKTISDSHPLLSISKSPIPKTFEPVLELAEAEGRRQAAKSEAANRAVLQTPSMLEKRSRPSRLERFSLYIPNFKNVPDSKRLQDTLKKAPHLDLATPPQRDAPPPPSRLPPQAPSSRNSSPTQHMSPATKLQKPQSPTRKLLSTNSAPIPPPHDGRRSRRSSLLPPVMQEAFHGRSVSSPLNTRPQTSNGELTFSKRKSWMGLGSRSQNASAEDLSGSSSRAWINAGSAKIDYNLSLLLDGEKVSNEDVNIQINTNKI